MAPTAKIEAFLAEPRNLVVAGIRRDGSPHLSPNWFYWDGQRFYISTTRHRAKYTIFRRDNRAQLLVDDCTGYRAVVVRGTVEVREDIAAELPWCRLHPRWAVMPTGWPDADRPLAALGTPARPESAAARNRAKNLVTLGNWRLSALAR